MKQKASLTYLSAFSGIGGFDLGLESAGFKPIGAIEMDPDARASYSLNFRKALFLEPNEILSVARSIRPEHLGLRPGALGILCGGPPCQPFSKAAQWSDNGKRGRLDPRAQAFNGFLELWEKFLPAAVVIENVPGFVRGTVESFSLIKRFVRNLNRRFDVKYSVDFRIVDAAAYGVPQHRVRALVIANRLPTAFVWPEEIQEHDQINAWDALGDLQETQEVPPKTLANWLQLLPTIPPGKNYLWHTRKGGGTPIFGYRTRYWSFLLKLDPRLPSWTIPASPGPYIGPFHWQNRQLTIKESLRLQSFPADWKLFGSLRSQQRQVGNATPPLLVEVIARAIAEQFFAVRYLTPPSLKISKARSALPSIHFLKRLPRGLASLKREVPDHPGSGRGPKYAFDADEN